MPVIHERSISCTPETCYPGTVIPTWSSLSEADRIVLYVMFACVAVFSIVFLVPFINWILFPVKMLSVAFHELSHGTAAILTCGRFVRIELEGSMNGFASQGGCCWTRGGVKWVVQCAGQLGSAFWSGILLFCCWNVTASTVGLIVCGAIWIIFLIFTSCSSTKNWFLALGLALFWWILLGVLLWIYWQQTPLRYICTAVASGMVSYVLVREVADLILYPICGNNRYGEAKVGVEQSDLTKFVQSLGCGTSRCMYFMWGIIWALTSIGFVLAGGLGGLILFHYNVIPS